MAYQRKTKDEYELYGMYDGEWAYLLTEDTYAWARAQKKCYEENERGRYKIVKKRVRIEEKQ